MGVTKLFFRKNAYEKLEKALSARQKVGAAGALLLLLLHLAPSCCGSCCCFALLPSLLLLLTRYCWLAVYHYYH